jgi:hypothetical protein
MNMLLKYKKNPSLGRGREGRRRVRNLCGWR